MKGQLLIYLLLVSISPLFGNTIEEWINDEKIVIQEQTQKVKFFIGKNKELNAEIETELIAVATTNLDPTFRRIEFTGYESELSRYEYKYNKFARKVDPIVSDYESNGIFHSDVKICGFEIKMSEKGYPLKLKYKKTVTDIKFLDPLYFNDVYRVDKSIIEIEVPQWLDIDFVKWNFDKETPAETVEKEKKKTIYTFILNDLSPTNEYGGQPRRSKINAHIICLPKTYTYKGKTKKCFQETKDLYNWYSSLVDKVNNNNSVLTAKVNELIEGKTTDEEKIKAIFYWVQDNIRYIAFEYGLMGFKPEACQDVYNNKYGDCKGMANLTKEMLTIAGYDARLTWLGTRDIPYTYEIPSLLVDNHMICTLFLNGEKIYLDATEKYSDYGTYARRIQGKEVMIEDGDNYIIDVVPEFSVNNKEETMHEFQIENGSSLVGTGSLKFTGDRKSYLIYGLSNMPRKDWNKGLKNYIGNRDKNISLTLQGEPSIETRDKDLVIDYSIQIDNHIIDLGDELYINPEIDNQFQSFDIPEERNVPYEFGGKYNVSSTVHIDIPEGWKLNYLPEPLKVDTDGYSFDLNYTLNDGKITYTKQLSIKDEVLDISEFVDWNQSIKKLKAFYEDQIIITKN